MRVLILGGTGAMGVHLADILSKGEVSLVITSRHSHKSHKNIKFIQGDAKDPAFFNTLVDEQWDAIVDFMVYSTEEFKQRLNLLLNATTQYLFISSARVLANADHPLTEDSERLLDVSEDKEYLPNDTPLRRFRLIIVLS